MRKIIRMANSLLMAAILCLGALCAPTVSVTAADNSNGDALHAMDILRRLDIIPKDYYDYNVDMNAGVTRADAVSAIAAMIKMDTAKASGVYYYDVPATHWAYDAIGVLTEMGIISGRDDKLFKPDDIIDKNEFCKLLVVVMGYGQMAEYKGGYPAGYLAAARSMKLMQNDSGNSIVTRSDLFMDIYQALTTDMQDSTAFTGTSIEYQRTKDRTPLAVYWNIFRTEGVVTGVNGVTLDGGILGSGRVMIDDTVYDTEISLTDYLGQKIEYYYKMHEKSGRDCVMWVGRYSSGQTLDIIVNNDASFDKTNYVLNYYNDNAQKKSVTLSRDITLVYNGGVVNSDKSEIFNKPRYTLRLVKNENGIYKTAIVWAYEDYIIDAIDGDEYSVYDKIVPGKVLELKESLYEYLDIGISEQAHLSFADLKQDNVLSVYMSVDKKYLTVRVKAEKVSGVIESVSRESYGCTLTVNGAEYYMPDNSQAELKAGDYALLYLNASGEVAGYTLELRNETYKPAYLIKGVFNENGLSNEIKLKLLQSDGTVETVNCAERLEVDGIVYKKAEAAEAYRNLCSDGKFKPQLAIIEKDKNGRIRMIDTANISENETEENSLSLNVPLQSQVIYRSNGVLGVHAVINNSSIIFAVPSEDQIDSANDDEFFILPRSELVASMRINFMTYKTTDRVGYEQFVVLPGYTLAEYNNNVPMLVESIGTAVNADGQNVECLYGYQGTNQVTLPAADKTISFAKDGVKPGMMLRIAKDRNTGEIRGYTKVFDYRDMDAYPPSSNADLLYRPAGGYLNDMVDGIVKIGYNDPSVIDQVMYSANIPVLVYDIENEREHIRIGSIKDGRTYRDAGVNCSKIFMLTRSSTPALFVMYN